MRSAIKVAAVALALLYWQVSIRAQDLAPRAYLITPLHSNALTLSYSRSNGDIITGSSLPLTGATGDMNLGILTYYHSLNVLGRSANVTVSLPYVQATYRGEVIGRDVEAYRSGLMDLVVRFSVNIKGAPAMDVNEFLKWRQKTLIGASIKVIAPTGQYDPSKLINPSTNRWAFKPEIGISQRWGRWLVDGYGAVWFFTDNNNYFSRIQSASATNVQSQGPIGAVEAHLSYDMRRRLWASFDANYWYGGRTSINNIESRPTLQANSRIGGTCSVPLRKHHSVKFSYSRGARIRFGGRNQNVSIAWQYSWLGKPR